MSQLPLAPPPPSDDLNQDRWLYLLWKRIEDDGQIDWTQLDTTGSNLTDIETRNHDDLQNFNTGNYRHLTSVEYTDLTDAGDSVLHYHSTDRDSANFTGTNWTDLTDAGATTLHKHDHALQDNLNSTNYYHLTSTERTDLLSAPYITVDHSNASLTGERALTVTSGLLLTDGGAGGSLALSPVAFIGDSGAGGTIGAVPAPAAGDGARAKYLSAEGIWRDPGTSGTIQHNNTLGISGGIATGVFEPTAFETTAFQQGVTEYYHVNASDFNEFARRRTVLSTAIDTTLDDDSATCLVTVTGKTITLPDATVARVGREWTVHLRVDGDMTITTNASDTIMTPIGPDTSVSVTIRSTSLTFRCISSTEWIIV